LSDEWSAQLLEARIRKFHLGLDTRSTTDVEVIGLVDQIAEQSRLSNARLASEHKNPGSAFSCPSQKVVQASSLGHSPEQLTFEVQGQGDLG
jgi:hypothetical protein